MPSRTLIVFAALMTAAAMAWLSPAPAAAEQLYVREKAKGGRGTRSRPFDAIYRAVAKASSGDVIHVAQGKYGGKGGVGYITINKNGLTLVGGYRDGSFTERNPFKYPTMVKETSRSGLESREGGYFRMDTSSRPTKHKSTTIDGFFFDRKGQNHYDQKGNLQVPLGSNSKPVIWFQEQDCHVRNCVFLNTAMYAVRVTGDGSSIVNNLFVNNNYAAIDAFGKGETIDPKNDYPTITIQHNTFVSLWNCCSFEDGAGAAIVHGGGSPGARLIITDNIFNLSNGNTTSLGCAIKSERKFTDEKWIVFKNNSASQLRGGVLRYFDPESRRPAGFDSVDSLQQSSIIDASGNDQRNPFFKLDKNWFKRYAAGLTGGQRGTVRYDVEDYGKMRRLMGLPAIATDEPVTDRNLAAPYPLDAVKGGALLSPANGQQDRGVQSGKLQIVRGTLLGGGSGAAGMDDLPVPTEYRDVQWSTLWSMGEELLDQGVEFRAYWVKWESTFSRRGKDYLEGATQKTHKILLMREVPKAKSASRLIKGFVPIGSEADAYFKKKAKRHCKAKGFCNYAFTVRGIVQSSQAKIPGGGPQIVIVVGSIGR